MPTSASMIVQLYHEETGTVIASINVRDGHPARLTGAIDLAEGESTISLRMYPYEWDGWGSYEGVGMQVVVGQTVEERGCSAGGGSPE
jgi:hypothetical protein